MQQLRQDYQKIVWELDPAQMIFLDESGIHRGMNRLFGRALSGERAHGSRPKNRGKNITMISAIWLEQVFHSRQPRTRQELDKAITDAFNTVTKKDLLGWFFIVML